MAAEIGVKVKIDGYAEFKKNIQEITQSQKTLKSEMAAVSSAWDKNTSAEKKNAEAKKNLAQQIDLQKQKVEQLQTALAQVEAKYGENSNEANSWREKLNLATAELNNMENQLRNMPNSIEQFGQSMQSAGEKISGLGDKVMPLSAAVAGIGAAAVKITADFDSSMSKVSAISGATGKDLEDLRAKAREMGAQTKFSAGEAADAFTYMAMAGWKTEDMMQGIDGIMNLAAADGLDLATTSDIVTDALTAMGLSAEDSEHFADVLAAASTNANTNVEMMGETFKYAAPLAGSLGFSIEDLAVATGLMANQGIKGSQAGTAMRGWLTRLAKPTKESATAMEALHLSLTDGEGKMKSLMTIMEETRDAFAGLTEDEKAQYAAMLAGQNGMSGFLAIVNATEGDLKKLSTATKNANGTAKKMAETMQNNLNGQITILKSSLEEAAISIGDALVPKIRELTGHVQDAVTWFNGLSDAEKQNVINAGLFVAAAGPVLKITGEVVKGVGMGVEAFGKLSVAVTEAGGILQFAGGILSSTAVTAGLVIAPLALLGAAMYDAGKKANGMTPTLQDLIDRTNELVPACEAGAQEMDMLIESISKSGDDIKASGTTLDYWRDQLESCYDESGNLKEGMEGVAEYALQNLNAAMGTDYSTEFIAQAKNSKEALDEISGAVDTYIEKLKQKSIEEAFSTQYAEAIKQQAESQTRLKDAASAANQALVEQEIAQKGVNEAMGKMQYNTAGTLQDPNAVANLKSATERLNTAKDAVEKTSEAFKKESQTAAEADSVVQSLDESMKLLAEGSVADAAEAYAKAGEEAKKAGEEGAQAAQNSLAEWQKMANETVNPPSIDQGVAAANAKQTTDTMQGTFDNNKFVGTVDKVDGGEAAAMNAAGQMTKIVSVPMQGNIDKVNGAEAAASAARSAMQSFMDQHPIIATVVEVVTGGRVHRSNVEGHAEGGLVTHETLSWLAEGNQPEMVIPLSAGKRDRALDLYAQTGQALGVGYLPAAGGSTTYNTGGNVINVYGAPGQDIHELAEEIADIINGDVQSKGAAWA